MARECKKPRYIFVRTGPWWSKIPLGYWVKVKREF